MGVCTSKSTVVHSSNRSDTFTNPNSVIYKRRGSATIDTNKEAPAVTIQAESYEQTGGATRDDANSTGARSINHATNENNEGREERNSSNERKPDIGRETEITSLSKFDEPNSQELLVNGVDSEKLINEDGRHSKLDTSINEIPDDNGRNNWSLTRDDANNTVRKDEGNIITEEHESTKDNDYEDPEDRPGSKQKLEPDAKSKKKFNLIRNAIKFIQRPEISQALVGDMDVNVPSQSRIVRIFISSTFTDTKNERNILMKKAYPKLKTLCQKLGYEFQVVDMRWGVRETATDSHTGTELCKNEIKLCQKLSTGPNFVSLVSHKYGYRMPPRTIESTIFEQIMLEIRKKGNNDAIQCFEKWYREDYNADPSEYVLATITSHFPDYFSSDTDKKSQSRSAYNKECDVMMSALEETVAGVEHSKSVTEVETRCGLLEVEDSSQHCVWFQRTIDKIEDQKPSDIKSKYMESREEDGNWKRSREFLAKMKQEMTSKLGDDKIQKYTVQWDTQVGINPKSEEHDRYLQKLADDFVEDLSARIKHAVKKYVPSDPVVVEVHRHIQFCKAKCETFYGRDDCLRKMKEYITGQNKEAMVVYGDSGCGKTSLMAKSAYLARQWTSDTAAVIFRFIGTSQRSTTIKDLLQSLTHQIKRIYRTKVTVFQNFKDIQQDFKESIELANEKMPLILILDSLDQLDRANDARELKWLPPNLPNCCKVILSTLPHKDYQCYPILEKSIKNKKKFLKVTPIPKDEVRKVIEIWLQPRKRTLTAKQMDRVLEVCKKCSLPLFLKLSFEEAIRWNSFSDEKETVLEDTVKGSINALFKKLEEKHGTMLVSRALGYLTVSQNGLTDVELEDVLSCDDNVLNDVYKFWKPPIRRLPPLLLVRLKTDLDQYLVERDADGSRVFYWYHRQFKETAAERYCSKKEELDLLHIGLADFFSGVWANDIPKPFTHITKNDKGIEEKQEGNEVRFVSAQPLKKKNLRKLNNLPLHRLKAGQLDQLKKECLCNFKFLLKKLRATNLWSVMDDFALAKSEFQKDEAIQMIHDALQISQSSLLYDPNQLPVQMILRLKSTLTKDTIDFISQIEQSSIPYLLPNKNVLLTPGDQLVRSMAGHKENSILSVDVSQDGQYTVTCGNDETVRIWHNVNGKLEHTHETEGIQKAYFCKGDDSLLICKGKIIVVKNKSGVEEFSISLDAMTWCLCGRRRESLVLFKNNEATMYNLETPEQMNPVKCEKEISFTRNSTQSFKGNSFLGSEQHAVAFSIQETTLCLFDVKQEQFVLYHNVCRDSSTQKDDLHTMQWAITHNETYIAYTCSRSKFIYFVKIKSKETLVKVQVFSAEYNDGEIHDLQMSRDKHYLTFILTGSNDKSDKSTLVVYSLEEPNPLKRESLNTSFTYASSSNGTTVVTSSKDALVEVWDLTRPEKGQNTNTTNKVYKYMQCLPNSRYVLGTYHTKTEDKIWIMFVYDVCKQKTVRRTPFPTDVDVLLTGNNTVIVWPLIEDNKTDFLIDLKMMSVVTELSGLPPMKQCHVYGNGEELISWTEEGQINLYSLPSGKKRHTLNVGTIAQLHVNRQGSVMTVNRHDMVTVYLENKILHSIKYQDFGVQINGIPLFTDDENYILFRVLKKPPMCQNGPEIKYLAVWDIQKGEMVSHLVDSEYYDKYKGDPNSISRLNLVDAIVLENKDKNRVLAAHKDYIMRLYDVETGLIQRIADPGRSTALQTFDGDSIVLSHGYAKTAFKIWDKETLKPVVSFKSDYKIDKLNIAMGGRYIIGTDENQGIVQWELKNGRVEYTVKPDSYSKDFPYKDTVVCLDLGIEVKKKEEGTIGEDEKNEEEEQDDASDQIKMAIDDDEENEEEDFERIGYDFYQAMMETDDEETEEEDFYRLGYDFIQAMMETDDDEETEEEDSNSSGDDVNPQYMDSDDDKETAEDSFLRVLYQMNSMLNLSFRI